MEAVDVEAAEVERARWAKRAEREERAERVPPRNVQVSHQEDAREDNPNAREENPRELVDFQRNTRNVADLTEVPA